jgi:hypothetical protein
MLPHAAAVLWSEGEQLLVRTRDYEGPVSEDASLPLPDGSTLSLRQVEVSRPVDILESWEIVQRGDAVFLEHEFGDQSVQLPPEIGRIVLGVASYPPHRALWFAVARSVWGEVGRDDLGPLRGRWERAIYDLNLILQQNGIPCRCVATDPVGPGRVGLGPNFKLAAPR